VDKVDIEDVIQTEMANLKRAVHASPLPEKRDDLVSFYGHDSFPGILNSLTSISFTDLKSLRY